MARPYVIVSSAQSLDGYIDDTSPRRLVLSNEADFDEVDELRASGDAILVGAGTVRRDNPRLVVKSEARVAMRVAGGRPPQPVKVTIVHDGELDPEARFFAEGPALKLVYCAEADHARLEHR